MTGYHQPSVTGYHVVVHSIGADRYAQLFVELCHRLIVMSAQESVSGFLLSVLCVSTHSPAIPNATPSTEFLPDKKTHR